jgi:hypothetical protein
MPKTLQFKKEVFKHKLMKMVIAANLPFRILEHPQFYRLLNLLRPNTYIPSPTTISVQHGASFFLFFGDLQSSEEFLKISLTYLGNKIA